MQFLSDVFVRCPDCNGRRYRPHILEVTAEPAGGPRWNIADLLDATVEEAIEFLNGFCQSRHAERAAANLERPASLIGKAVRVANASLTSASCFTSRALWAVLDGASEANRKPS